MQIVSDRPDLSVLRPSDDDALLGELRTVARDWAMPAAIFGGLVSNGKLEVTATVGTRTRALRGLTVPPSAGLGGRALAHLRPQCVDDYIRSSTITHEYDRAVVLEGLRSIVAVPVVVGGSPRAVLYAAPRGLAPAGDRGSEMLIKAARRLAAEIVLRDEVDRRLVQVAAATAAPSSPEQSVLIEGIREIHTELRALANASSDESLRHDLGVITGKLVALSQGDIPGSVTPLTRRELDVLAQVAVGCSNAMAARRLSIQPETVKSYLREAMAKLGVHSRHEAVARARRLGMLP